MIGKDLNKILQDKFGLKPDHARKVVQRAVDKNIIYSSAPVSFGNGQYIYSLGSLNIQMIKRISKKNRPPLYRLISLLEKNNGVISFYEGLKITASPLDKSKTKMDYLNNIIGDLKELKLIKDIKIYDGIKYIIDMNINNDQEPDLIDAHKTKMIIDCTFIRDILYYLQRHNLIDNKSVVYRNKDYPSKGAEHNNFVWDAFAYTKTTGINTVYKSNKNIDDKSTLVVIDVLVSRQYTDIDLQGFFNRVQGVVYNSKSQLRKVMPIIVVKDISEEAHNKIFSLGIIILSLGTIYGEKIYEIIKNLEYAKGKTLEETLQTPEDKIAAIERILSLIDVSGQNENLQNMKGDLFEMAMYPLISSLCPGTAIKQGTFIKDTEKNVTTGFEYDYIVTDDNIRERIVFELKGYKNSNYINLGDSKTKNTIRWFFRNTFPFAAKHIEDGGFIKYNVKGCYITTAKFSADALSALEKINTSKLKPNNFESYYDGEKLLALMKKYGLQNLINLIEKYYM
jgi:hypothetical protein